MSRFNKFAHSLASGYLQMAANVVYTFASVPLAWHYLSPAEFGLWGTTTAIISYILLLDLGMSGAAMRILIDYKDHPQDGRYGSVILTGFLVNATHCAIVLAAGVVAARLLPPLLKLPPDLVGKFHGLMIWQSVLMGMNAACRTPVMVLTAHQRYDVVNVSQALLFVLNLGVLWLGFALGQGVYSMVWGQGVAQVLGSAVAVVGCWRLRLMPERGCWGRPSWGRFLELFVYGRDMFLYLLGSLMISASQTILITRVLGLDVGAVWSVCTRGFNLLSQFLNRLFDYSSPVLAEMIVRGEKERLFARFRSLMVLTASLSALAAIGIALMNQPFVTVWIHGRVSWSSVNDGLLGIWLLILVLVRNHTGLVGLVKDFRFLRYLFLVEGTVALSLGYWALHRGGITAMLVTSLLASMFLSLPYSVWRTSQFFGATFSEVGWGWSRPALRLMLVLAVPLALIATLTETQPALVQLAVRSVFILVFGGWGILRFGVDPVTREEIVRRFPKNPAWLKSWFGATTSRGI